MGRAEADLAQAEQERDAAETKLVEKRAVCQQLQEEMAELLLALEERERKREMDERASSDEEPEEEDFDEDEETEEEVPSRADQQPAVKEPSSGAQGYGNVD